MQIRSLAMSSYLQAMISKVHCLGKLRSTMRTADELIWVLEDVQATLLLSAWGLLDRGASPDPWLLTGSAYRLARRLGMHLVPASLASGIARPTAKLVASLQTYLCLYAFDRL